MSSGISALRFLGLASAFGLRLTGLIRGILGRPLGLLIGPGLRCEFGFTLAGALATPEPVAVWAPNDRVVTLTPVATWPAGEQLDLTVAAAGKI